MLSRTRRLATYTWSTASTQFSFTVISPQTELVSSLASIVNITNFRHISYDSVKVRFTPSTTKFFRGMLGITWIPGAYDKNNGGFYNATALSNMPTTYLDASSMAAVEVACPWTVAVGKYHTGSLTVQGHLVVWPVATLVAETAPSVSTSLPISIEANFENPHLHDPDCVPISIPGPPARVFNNASSGGFHMAQSSRSAPPVEKEATLKAERGTISSLLDTTSKISSAASTLPLVGPFAAGLSVVSGAASHVAQWFGMSKPLNQTITQFVQQQPNRGQCNFHGVTNAQSMSTDIQPFVSTEPHFVASQQDDLDFSLTLKRPTLIRTVPTVITGGTPTLLAAIPVHPRYCWQTLANNFVSSNMDSIASMFNSWSGDIGFKVIVPGSSMSRVRLAITYSWSKPSAFSENMRYMYVEVDSTATVDAVIPWSQVVPFLPLPLTRGASTAMSPNGYFSIFQITDVIGSEPGVTPPPLSVLVFATAGQNITFSGYRQCLNGLDSYHPGVPFPQSFLGLSETVTFPRVLAEDNVRSYREILHRPLFCSQVNIPASANADLPLSVLPEMFKYILQKFRYYRGSLNVRITASPAATFSRGTFVPLTSSNGAFIEWYPESCPVITVTLPFLAINGYLETGGLSPYQTVGTINISNPLATSCTYFADVSFNDDFSAGCPIPNKVCNRA